MEDTVQRIEAIRREWGKRLLILGHHYQRASVLQHTDERGDSLELARKATQHPEAQRIVFCGVRFMAESADILTRRDQVVYMPDTSAGCPMAAMIGDAQMEAAWANLPGGEAQWVPVAYVNSTAAVKACCGRRGGSTCTSSNAARVIERVFRQGRRVFFVPDEHLGVNTAHDLGLPDEQIALYDRAVPGGGLSAADYARARIVVWKGFCLVHVAFTAEHVAAVRRQLPGAKIIVHPECPKEIVRLADAHGSTSQIIQYVERAPAGSTVVVGTELNLVERLAAEQAGRVTVKALAPSVCANMAKTSPGNVLELLGAWPADHEVHVPPDVARDARLALTRMLEA